MRDYLFLGPVPSSEECAQTVDPNYELKAQVECQAFINQILRVLASKGIQLLPNVKIVTKSAAHDFGTYYEVAVQYDPDDEAAVNLSCKIEEIVPEEWDDIARKVLSL